MEVTIKQAADLLRVTEKTIYRWIRQGVIPVYKENDDFWFKMDELRAWARYKRLGEFSESDTAGSIQDSPEEAEEPDLTMALQRGGIHRNLKGNSLEEIYRTVVDILTKNAGVSETVRQVLYSSMLEREKLASTGIGGGVAIPHPRHPRDWGLNLPFCGIFFLEKPVDMGAPDNEPVFVLFVLLTSTVKGHRRLLSQVSHLLHSQEAKEMLRNPPGNDVLKSEIETLLTRITND